MNRFAFFQSRDGMFALFVWVVLILIVLRDPMLPEENPLLLAVFLAGGACCSVPVVMYYHKINLPFIKYVVATLLSLMALYELLQHFCMANYLLLYMNIALLSLYSSLRLMVYQGIWVIGITLSAWLFHLSSTLAHISSTLPLLSGALLLTVVFGINALRTERRNAVWNRKSLACAKLHAKANAAAHELHSAIDLLQDWSTELEQEIRETRQLCQEIIGCLDSANLNLTCSKDDPQKGQSKMQYTELSGAGMSMDTGKDMAGSPLEISEIQERFLRITAKMLLVAEHTTASRQAAGEIKAGLFQGYNKLNELLLLQAACSLSSSKQGEK
ncbi:hypothetical protein [Paenibacillus pinistramenti]|uniref:hypothetical protein n=1 Tax=Paenibacillus pinistramenti TaxID=1768003 RepID=UPI00110A0347|nr:hypothetical protein [Paenibacillus pinistramenti]